MASVLVAEPGHTNEQLCGWVMAVWLAGLWHHAHTTTGERLEHTGKQSTAGVGGHVLNPGLTSQQRNPYFSSEPFRIVPAKPVSLKTPVFRQQFVFSL